MINNLRWNNLRYKNTFKTKSMSANRYLFRNFKAALYIRNSEIRIFRVLV